jgi:hypothetical protein
MKGLFIKDIKCIWKLVVTCIVIMFLMLTVFKVVSEDFDVDFINKLIICVYFIIGCGSLVSTTMLAEDEKFKFDIYTFILPIDKKLATLEKVIMSLSIIVFYAVIGILTVTVLSSKPSDQIWYIVCIAVPIALVMVGLEILISKYLGTASAFVSTFVVGAIMLVAIFVFTGVLDSILDLEAILYKNRAVPLVVGIILYIILSLAACNVREEC